MPLAAGSRFGSYEIVGPLGAGGMGEVYRAHDSRLGRDVALKVLPESLTSDDIARARLIREARTAATLSHPNICTVFEVGEVSDRIFIAMELVPGRTLGESIPTGGCPAETVLRYGAQIADALAHAHAQGVIHRDLKSSNVVITPEGRAKVLDFGLARRASADDEAGRLSADLTLTETGAIVGTPQYLAPEVLRGERGDERSDIWALGVLLYEMSAGALPFAGRTGFQLSAAILNETPAPLPARVSPGLRALIQRCLVKQATERFRNAGEARAALEALQSDAHRPMTVQPGAASRRAFWVGVVLLVTAILTVVVWLAIERPWRTKELKQRQLTSNPAENPVGYGVISPDGKTLAMTDAGGLSLRVIDTGESSPLEIPQGFTLSGYPFPMINWYPDGKRLLLTGKADDGTSYVWELPVLGGRAHKIIVGASLATVSRDGSHLAFVKRGEQGEDIWCSGPNGEDPQLVTASDTSGSINTWATWSPSGQRVAYRRVSVGPRGPKVALETCDLNGHRRVAFSNTSMQNMHPLAVSLWLSDGRLLIGLSDPPPGQGDMNLWSLRVDPATGDPRGGPQRITQWQRLSLVAPTGVSADGRRLSLGLLQYQSDCYIGDVARGDSVLRDIRRLTLDNRFDLQPSWMPDSKAIVFASDRNGSMDVFRQALDATEAEPLATGPGGQTQPSVSPDGAWILYKEVGVGPLLRTDSRSARIMRIPVSGGPAEKVLDTQAAATFVCSQRAGSLCVLNELEGSQSIFTAFDPLEGRGRPLARLKADPFSAWSLSPDGSALAIVDQADSLPHIQVISTRGGAARDVRLDRKFGIADIAWTADGGGWLVVGGTASGGWRLLRVGPGGKTVDLVPHQMWMYSSSASPDGRHVVYTTNTVEANIWLLEDF